MPPLPASFGRQERQASSRLVHVLKGAALLTFALPDARTREALEAAAWGLEVALANASLVVVNGKSVTLREQAMPHPAP